MYPGSAIGVFIHIYYPELSEEVFAYLGNIPSGFAAYISTDTQEKADAIASHFEARFPRQRPTVKVLPNRGWDVGPFVAGFSEELRRHPLALKIHAKKSDNQRSPIFGLRWRAYLLSELLGSPQRVAQILGEFASDRNLGVVGARHWAPNLRWMNIGNNFAQMRALLGRIGRDLQPDQEIDFPSGSMFWFRPEALKPLFDLKFTFDDFAVPADQSRDATLAHAIERSIYYFCERSGMTHKVMDPLMRPIIVESSLMSRRMRLAGVAVRYYPAWVFSFVRARLSALPRYAAQRITLAQLALGWFWSVLTMQTRNRKRFADRILVEASGLFDASHYLQQAPGDARRDPVKHYVESGVAAGKNPQAFFDTAFYLARNRDVAAASINPLHHYAANGWREGREPHPDFDGGWYARRYRDFGKQNPLLHYTQHGRFEHREVRAVVLGSSTPVVAPSTDSWSRLPKLADVTDAIVDIVIPVFRGYADTLACIYSVLESEQACCFEVIVINDAGPDVKLNETLRSLADHGFFTYLENAANLGFVQTANRGIALHLDRDVILLNSDTLVHGDWIDRMLRHAHADPSIATITPLSNNATICSYPNANRGGNEPLECDYRKIDAFSARVNAFGRNEVPTGVGFCFYMNRKAIRDCGNFDAETFGRGYGEENDFCRRAAKRGYKNVLAHDIFVHHTGEVSFSEEKQKLCDEAQRKLGTKHPEYGALVQQYIKNDPSRLPRIRLDAARLADAFRGRLYIFITHNFGGGTETYVRDLVELAEAENAGVLIFRVGGSYSFQKGNGITIEFSRNAASLALPNLEELDPLDSDLVEEVLCCLSPRLVHVHSVAGLDKAAIESLFSAIQMSGLPYIFTWHDHMPLCHRIQFVKPGGRYCGEPAVEVCRICVKRDWTVSNEFDPAIRREVFGRFLGDAERVLCPSESAAARASRLVNRSKLVISPHFEAVNPDHRAASMPAQQMLKIAIIGEIVTHKGANLLAHMAADAEIRGLPIEYVVIGASSRMELSKFSKVTITGRYKGNAEAARILREEKPHLCFFPSIWPETYCYTLSTAFENGIPPVVLDHGAQAERVRAAGWGRVLHAGIEHDPGAINDLLLSLPLEVLWSERRPYMATAKPASLKNYYEGTGLGFLD